MKDVGRGCPISSLFLLARLATVHVGLAGRSSLSRNAQSIQGCVHRANIITDFARPEPLIFRPAADIEVGGAAVVEAVRRRSTLTLSTLVGSATIHSCFSSCCAGVKAHHEVKRFLKGEPILDFAFMQPNLLVRR